MSNVATIGPTPVESRHVPRAAMRHRNFRLDDETWEAASRIAELTDERISDVMRDLVRGYVRRHKKLLDADPVWQEKQRERNAG